MCNKHSSAPTTGDVTSAIREIHFCLRCVVVTTCVALRPEVNVNACCNAIPALRCVALRCVTTRVQINLHSVSVAVAEAGLLDCRVLCSEILQSTLLQVLTLYMEHTTKECIRVMINIMHIHF